MKGAGWEIRQKSDFFTVVYDGVEGFSWANDIKTENVDRLLAALKAWKKAQRKPEWAVRFKHKVSRLEGWFQGCAWGASTGSRDQRLKYQDRAAALSDLWWLRAQGHTAKLVRI
jgi:hypothetical protein